MSGTRVQEAFSNRINARIDQVAGQYDYIEFLSQFKFLYVGMNRSRPTVHVGEHPSRRIDSNNFMTAIDEEVREATGATAQVENPFLSVESLDERFKRR